MGRPGTKRPSFLSLFIGTGALVPLLVLNYEIGFGGASAVSWMSGTEPRCQAD
jgi:hypothetical protein